MSDSAAGAYLLESVLKEPFALLACRGNRNYPREKNSHEEESDAEKHLDERHLLDRGRVDDSHDDQM